MREMLKRGFGDREANECRSTVKRSGSSRMVTTPDADAIVRGVPHRWLSSSTRKALLRGPACLR